MTDDEQRKLVEVLRAECEYVCDDGRCESWLGCKRLGTCPIMKHNTQRMPQVAEVKET